MAFTEEWIRDFSFSPGTGIEYPPPVFYYTVTIEIVVPQALLL